MLAELKEIEHKVQAGIEERLSQAVCALSDFMSSNSVHAIHFFDDLDGDDSPRYCKPSKCDYNEKVTHAYLRTLIDAGLWPQVKIARARKVKKARLLPQPIDLRDLLFAVSSSIDVPEASNLAKPCKHKRCGGPEMAEGFEYSIRRLKRWAEKEVFAHLPLRTFRHSEDHRG
jgi:hypothetical protein